MYLNYIFLCIFFLLFKEVDFRGMIILVFFDNFLIGRFIFFCFYGVVESNSIIKGC